MPLQVRGFTSHRYEFSPAADRREPAFWSYQSASYEARPDWVLPLGAGYRRDNYLGMNDSDYGGGTPVVDVWRRDVGLAIGHLELVPKLVSLPIERQKRGGARLALAMKRDATIAPGQSMETLRSFVAVHRGDYFDTLRAYSAAMQAQGIRLPDAPKDAFDPIWCAWGYGRTFTPVQVFETLPVVKQLGFGWAVLDDGWQVALGDWRPRPDKFPAGDADMKALVDRIHAAGLKAQLWWAPLGADPGSRTEREHPDWLLRNADGSTRKISWWDSQYLCPAVDARPRRRCGIREEGHRGMGIRRSQDRRTAPERGARVLQPGARTCDTGGGAGGHARLLQGDLGFGAGDQAGRSHRDLPLRHRLFLLHAALPQHDRSIRPGELLADPHQGQDAQGACRRPHRVLRRLTSN